MHTYAHARTLKSCRPCATWVQGMRSVVGASVVACLRGCEADGWMDGCAGYTTHCCMNDGGRGDIGLRNANAWGCRGRMPMDAQRRCQGPSRLPPLLTKR